MRSRHVFGTITRIREALAAYSTWIRFLVVLLQRVQTHVRFEILSTTVLGQFTNARADLCGWRISFNSLCVLCASTTSSNSQHVTTYEQCTHLTLERLSACVLAEMLHEHVRRSKALTTLATHPATGIIHGGVCMLSTHMLNTTTLLHSLSNAHLDKFTH